MSIWDFLNHKLHFDVFESFLDFFDWHSHNPRCHWLFFLIKSIFTVVRFLLLYLFRLIFDLVYLDELDQDAFAIVNSS